MSEDKKTVKKKTTKKTKEKEKPSRLDELLKKPRVNANNNRALMLDLATLCYDYDLALKLTGFSDTIVSGWDSTWGPDMKFKDQYAVVKLRSLIEVDKRLLEFGLEGNKQALLEIRKNTSERKLTIDEKETRAKKRITKKTTTPDELFK